MHIFNKIVYSSLDPPEVRMIAVEDNTLFYTVQAITLTATETRVMDVEHHTSEWNAIVSAKKLADTIMNEINRGS